MTQPNRITLVLRPHAGTTIEELQQYAKLGMPVGVGRSLGVIAGASEGDVMQRAEQLEHQVVLAESAMRRGVVIPDECVPASVPQHIDERIQAAAAEPVFLTMVFKLPNAQAVGPLISQLPYGHLALGTEAKVFGMTTGNLMEVEPCEA